MLLATRLPAELPVPLDVLWVLGATAAALLAATALRLALWSRRSPSTDRQRGERLRSLVTWWVLLAALALAVLGGRLAIAILFMALSLFGMWEYRRLTHPMVEAGRVWSAAFALVVAHYGALYVGYVNAAWVGTPLAGVLLLVLFGLTTGRTEGFLHATAIPLLGLMLVGYCLSYAAMVGIGPAADSSRGEPVSGFLFLVLVTELHDIAQALWGRTVGRHKITPRISPGKTWEGLLLGTATTVCLAAVLAPLLADPGGSPSSHRWQFAAVLAAVGGGLIIGVSGFLGDISMSAVKRACGVKDSGTLLPGQGGVLDRIDSLMFAAPAFYYYTLALARHSGE